MKGELWALIAGCAAVTFAIKAAGPVTLGGRDLPPRLSRVVVPLAPALLAALVVTQALADGERLHVGADTVGVTVAGVVVWRGGSVLPAVGLAGRGDRGPAGAGVGPVSSPRRAKDP